MHEGIDVSGFQGLPDFGRVRRAGYRFVYVKATEGTTFVDKGYRQRQQDACRNGLHTGFYHFLRPRADRNGRTEAEHFYANVEGIRGGEGRSRLMRLALDVEVTELSPGETVKYTTDCMEHLKNLCGHRPILYTFPAFLRDWGSLSEYRLWIANYDVSKPTLPSPFRDWAIWQYTSKGEVPGVKGEVDKNHCPHLTPILLDRPHY